MDSLLCPWRKKALTFFYRSKGDAVVRALASHQCGPGSNPGVDNICGLSLLLFLSLAPRDFSLACSVFPSPQKPTLPNSNSTRNQVDEEPFSGCVISKLLFIYLFKLNVLNRHTFHEPLSVCINGL